MDAAAFAELPPSAIRLVECLARTVGRKECALCQLPKQLRAAELLHFAHSKGLVQIVVQRRGAIATATQVLGYTTSWIDYRHAGYSESLDAAMKVDPINADPTKQLHIRLTRNAMDAVIERRVRMREQPMPADAMPCCVITDKYYVTSKTLYQAISDGRLTGYRPPGAAKNSRYFISEKDVARYWPSRAEKRAQPSVK